MTDPNITQIEAYLEDAEARILEAESTAADTSERLYQEATDLLLRAERLMKGSGAWLMSCIHARRDNGAMCIQWLERARSASMLPDIDTIRTHTHYAKAREKRWFHEWLNQEG